MATQRLEYFENDLGILSHQGTALQYRLRNDLLRIESWGKDSLRVRITRSASIRDDLPGALIGVDELGKKPTADVKIDEKEGIIRNGKLEARVTLHGGKITFYNAQTGEEVLAEGQPHMWINGRTIKPLAGDAYKIEAQFKAYDGERMYGLGQSQHGRLDQKGCVIDLCQRNSHVSIPFLVSSRGYGFLWNNPAVGRVELGYNLTRWVAEVTSQLDYWVTLGDTPAAILENYVDVTGHAPLLPYYASGFWQCRLRYKTQDEVLSIAREYRKRGLPLEVIVIDFFHWTAHGDWKFDPECFPDPAAMVKELKELNVEVMVSIWPTVTPSSENFDEMERNGFLVSNSRGPAVHHRFVDTKPKDYQIYITHYDATNPDARKYIWSKVEKNYFKHGIKLWWLDADEPEVEPVHPEMLRFHIGDGASVYNISPMLHARGFYEGMKSAGLKDGDILSLSRSGWAGSQRWGAAIWSGDIESTFEVLQVQVRAGLSIGLSGIPWWTTDIGGFVHGNIHDKKFRELIVRWFQYGTFCPLFRLHGYRDPIQMQWYGAENEVWSFGETAYGIISELLHLRERLRPYIMEQMKCASDHGVPPMRPLFFDFHKDTGTAAVDDQFMFGPDILVAPVLHYEARSREVYLPAGAKWTDVWSGKELQGGQTIKVDAPLEIIPLYLRDGAKLPIRKPQ